MVLTAVKRGEKIILPRNVHRSVMGAMVLGGAVPVYVNPAGDKNWGFRLECVGRCAPGDQGKSRC